MTGGFSNLSILLVGYRSFSDFRFSLLKNETPELWPVHPHTQLVELDKDSWLFTSAGQLNPAEICWRNSTGGGES